MDEAEYDRALTYLYSSLEGLSLPQLYQSVVSAAPESRGAGAQLIGTLRALRSEIAESDRNRVARVLDRLNTVVTAEDGGRVERVYLELSDAEARAAGVERLDLSEQGGDLHEVVEALDVLIQELEDDGAGDGSD